jgi:hypothetical protein
MPREYEEEAPSSEVLTICASSDQPRRTGGASPSSFSADEGFALAKADFHEVVMSSESLVSRLRAPLIALFLMSAITDAPVHAAEGLRKVTVVSFGLFGDQGVFRREATGAAQIVASRFGHGSVVVRSNTKTGGGATIKSLAATLQAEAKKMDRDSDILFLVLTSHGSSAGLAITAARRAETLKPSTLAEMLDQTGVRHKVVIIGLLFWRLHSSPGKC